MTTIDGDRQIDAVARMFADRSRAAMCLALIDGRFRTAGELAKGAGISASTASGHLALLVEAGILVTVPQGRNRYFRLRGPEVAAAMEALGNIAPAAPIRSLHQDRTARQLRDGRSCYDHLAGRLGVGLTDALVRQEILTADLAVADVSPLVALGVDIPRHRRPMIRPCVDWTERRYHIAGALPAALMQRLFALSWIERGSVSRQVNPTTVGRRMLTENFGVTWADSLDEPVVATSQAS